MLCHTSVFHLAGQIVRIIVLKLHAVSCTNHLTTPDVSEVALCSQIKVDRLLITVARQSSTLDIKNCVRPTAEKRDVVKDAIE